MFEVVEPDKPAEPAAITPAHILAEAVADQPAAPGAAAAPAAPAAVDPHAEAVDLVEFAGSLFFPVYPSLVPIYPLEVRKRIAAALAPLMAKYGWTMSGFGPEVMFGMTVVPLIAPTIQAIRADRGTAAAAPSGPDVPAPDAEAPPAGDVPLTERFPGLNASEKK